MDLYRVTKESPAWLHKAYDYVRVDAFVFGQNIPINVEYSFPETIDEEYKAVVLIDEGKQISVSSSILSFSPSASWEIYRISEASKSL